MIDPDITPEIAWGGGHWTLDSHVETTAYYSRGACRLVLYYYQPDEGPRTEWAARLTWHPVAYRMGCAVIDGPQGASRDEALAALANTIGELAGVTGLSVAP